MFLHCFCLKVPSKILTTEDFPNFSKSRRIAMRWIPVNDFTLRWNNFYLSKYVSTEETARAIDLCFCFVCQNCSLKDNYHVALQICLQPSHKVQKVHRKCMSLAGGYLHLSLNYRHMYCCHLFLIFKSELQVDLRTWWLFWCPGQWPAQGGLHKNLLNTCTREWGSW